MKPKNDEIFSIIFRFFKKYEKTIASRASNQFPCSECCAYLRNGKWQGATEEIRCGVSCRGNDARNGERERKKKCINFDLCTQEPRRHTNLNLSQLILWIIRFNITSLAYKVPNILHLLNAKSIHTHIHSLETRYTCETVAVFRTVASERCVCSRSKTTFQMTADMYLHTCPKLKPIVRVLLSRSAIIFMANDERRAKKNNKILFTRFSHSRFASISVRLKIWFIHRLKHWSSNRFVSLCASSSHHFVEQHFPFRFCSFLALLLLLRCLLDWLSFVVGFRLYRNSILSLCSHHRRSLPRHFTPMSDTP